jgi:hypothetical protein
MLLLKVYVVICASCGLMFLFDKLVDKLFRPPPMEIGEAVEKYLANQKRFCRDSK